MKTTQVVGAIALGVAVGVAATLLIKGGTTTPTDPCLVPGDHVIDVRSDGSLSCPEAWVLWRVSRVVWQSPSGTTLTVHFRATSITQPVCSGNGCTWGPPMMSSPSTQPYDYDVTLTATGPPTQTNGRIIVKK
jgi:hypothetical protein